jgi:hypothetical protein
MSVEQLRAIGAKNVDLRRVLAIVLQRYPIAEVLPAISDAKELVLFLCELLADKETDISQAALKTLETVPSVSPDLVIDGDVVALLTKHATGKNSTVQLRFLEVVIRLGNATE